jgi:hypothetical protein
MLSFSCEKQVHLLDFSYFRHLTVKLVVMINMKELFGNGQDLDEKSLDILVKTIEKNNLPGFDYYEFKRAVAMLMTMQLDESTSFKSAYQTAATLGITKEKLVESAQYYRNLVQKESANFGEALEKHNQTKIADKQNEIARYTDQIARHQADLNRLQEEIATYQAKVEQTKTQLEADSNKLSGTKSAFEKTLSSVLLTLDTDIEKIHQHLS